jgi:hypothetical protein
LTPSWDWRWASTSILTESAASLRLVAAAALRAIEPLKSAP